MKTLIYFFITATVSYIIAMAGIVDGHGSNMMINNVVAFGTWGLFLWHVNGVAKKKQRQRQWDNYQAGLSRQRNRR